MSTLKKLRPLLIVVALASALGHGFKAYTASNAMDDNALIQSISTNKEIQSALRQAGSAASEKLLTAKHCQDYSMARAYLDAVTNGTSNEDLARTARAVTITSAGKAMSAAMQEQPSLVKEAERVGADLSRVARRLSEAAVATLESAKGAIVPQWAVKDAVTEARAMDPVLFMTAEMTACALDTRVMHFGGNLASATTDAYSGLRRLAQEHAVGATEQEDLFARYLEAAPPLVEGVTRWRSVGPFVVIAELSPESSGVCDLVNTAVAMPLPEWAHGEALPVSSGQRRWACEPALIEGAPAHLRFDGRLSSLARKLAAETAPAP